MNLKCVVDTKDGPIEGLLICFTSATTTRDVSPKTTAAVGIVAFKIPGKTDEYYFKEFELEKIIVKDKIN